MREKHKELIGIFMKNIGMDGLNFDQNHALSFAINQELQIVLHNKDDGVIFIAPLQNIQCDGDKAVILLEYNHKLALAGEYAQFGFNKDENIVIFQNCIHTHHIHTSDQLEKAILKNIQFCENMMKSQKNDSPNTNASANSTTSLDDPFSINPIFQTFA